MGWCTAQWKMLLFCAKTIVKESRKFELARMMMMMMMMMMEEEEESWPSGDFLVQYFCHAF